MTPVITRPGRSSVGLGSIVAAVGIFSFVAVMLTVVITVGVWPGEATLTAPVFCPDDKPEAFVVVDTYRIQPGETSYNYTLYCMGPRGEVEDVGFLRPCAVLALGHAGLLIGLIGVFRLVRWARRRR